MILVVGGLAQGKLDFAREELGVTEWSEAALTEKNCVHDLHKWVKTVENPGEVLDAWLESHPDAVLLCNEVGSGVVPLDRGDREWREAVGRLCCRLAQKAQAVYRVSCGVGVRIK